MAVLAVFLYAAIACVPDLGISQAELVQWWGEWMSTSKMPPSFEQHLTQIMARKEAIYAHFSQIRDGYAAPLVCVILVLAALFYMLVWVVWNYIFEGLAERPTQHAEGLLGSARAALPPEFPQTRLVSAPVTFVRYRIIGGVTTFLSNRLLVRLCKGQRKEFQFILFHEVYHLRCFDPLCNSISKSLRRLLAILGATACALMGGDWAVEALFGHHARSPLASFVRLVTWVVIFSAVLHRLGRLDVAFLKHKELLADRYAWRSRPDANLDAIYDREIYARSHPAREERIRFLREGRCSTACAAFLRAQEIILCCVFLVSSPSIDFMGTLPRTLEFPSFVLALTGSLILGAEACARPLPLTDRDPLIRRASFIVILCLPLGGSLQETWFSLAILVINCCVLFQIAASEGKPVGEAVASEKRRPAFQVRERREPMSLGRVFEITGLVFSWTAIVWIVWTALMMMFNFATIRGFGRALPPGLSNTQPIGPMLLSFVESVVLGFAVVRNLKRPNALTLGLEWLFFGAMLFGLCGMGLWLSDRVSPQGWAEGIVLEALRLPWGNPQELRRLVRVDLVQLIWVTSLPQLALAAFYGGRVRASYQQGRKERAKC